MYSHYTLPSFVSPMDSSHLQNTLTPQYYLPSSFTLDDTSTLSPLPADWAWGSLGQIFKEVSCTHAILNTLPPIYQLEPLINAQARTQGLAVISTPVSHTTMITKYQTDVQIDVCIVLEKDWAVLDKLFQSTHSYPKAVVVIHSFDNPFHPPAASYQIANELHLIPGVPILHQTADSYLHATRKKFDLNTEFHLTAHGNIQATTLSALFPEDIPLPDSFILESGTISSTL